MDKLTPTQKRVMKWINSGWTLYNLSGNGVTANGKWICNESTMNVLKRLGLVDSGSMGDYTTWRKSAKGKTEA